jgi:hypothetical protein
MATKAATKDVVTKIAPTAALAAFAEMVAIIPDADDSEAALGMLAQVLNSEDVKHTNNIWGDDDGDKDQMVGDTLDIFAIKKRPSDFKDGLPFYLDCEVINRSRNMEPMRYTCSATMAVAQLVQATVLGQMPVRVRVEENQTRSGNKAIHLFILETNVAVQEGL